MATMTPGMNYEMGRTSSREEDRHSLGYAAWVLLTAFMALLFAMIPRAAAVGF